MKEEKPNSTSRWSRRSFLHAGTTGLATATLAPSVLACPEQPQVHWDEEADVIVCGSGAAGSMAALTARKAGATVLMLEKSAVWGGTSAKSGFHIWIPNNDEMKKLGIEDDKTDCLKYMAQHAYPHLFDPNSQTLGLPDRLYTMLDTYYDNARLTVRKLAQWDVVEFRVARLGYEDIAAVDYNDNSPYNKATVGRSMGPIDRHGNDRTGGYVTGEFRRKVEESGVKTRIQHRAMQLHFDKQQRVIGVQAVNKHGETVNLRARRAVVFGSGCFSNNKDYLNQFHMMPVMGSCGAPSNQGDFIAIAGAAGAQLGNMSGAWRAQMVLEDTINYASVPTSVFWPMGDSMLVVNKYGNRCVNEKRNYNDRTKALYRYDANRCEFPDMINFMIYDQRCADLYGGRYPIPRDPNAVEYVAQGNTLSELADDIAQRLEKHAAHTGDLKLDAQFTKQLNATVARFNRMAKSGIDEDFSRGEFEYDEAWHNMQRPRPDARWPEPVNPENPTMHPLQAKGPYYAIVLLPGCIGTNGGPVINEHSQVLNYANQAIEGLYGAGNCIASPAANAYWGGGTTIGSALIFGRIAGEMAAKEPIKENVS